MGVRFYAKPHLEIITVSDVRLVDNTTSAYSLILDSDSDGTVLDANRTLIFDVNNANRVIDLAGDLTLTGNNTVATWASTGAIEANSAGATGEIGIDFNSISSTYSTICQSDAEGIAVSSDLRIGLDETNRNLIICDRGDIATDFGRAASSSPRVFVYSNDASNWSALDYTTISLTLGNTAMTDDGVSSLMDSWRLATKFRKLTDIDAGDAFQFISAANIELTDADAEQAWMYLGPKINQTSTAGYIGLLMDVTETSTGSGTNALMDLRVATASKFKVENDGVLDLSGQTITTVNGSGSVDITDWTDAIVADGAETRDPKYALTIKVGGTLYYLPAFTAA